MEAASLTGVVGTGDDDFFAFMSNAHDRVELIGEFALGALDSDGVVLDGNLDSGGNRNRLLTDTRHI